MTSWERLHGCRGRSERVPGWLRALRDENSGDAYGELFDHVCHQGTRWQVSAAVVPFLVELIDAEGTPGRGRLVAMLTAVAVGDRRDDALPFDAEQAYPDGRGLTGEQEQRLVTWLEEGGDGGADEEFLWDMSGPDTWALRAYRAAEKCRESIAGWVNDEDAEVAARAAALVAWFPPTPEIVGALLAAGTASANLALAHVQDDKLGPAHVQNGVHPAQVQDDELGPAHVQNGVHPAQVQDDELGPAHVQDSEPGPQDVQDGEPGLEHVQDGRSRIDRRLAAMLGDGDPQVALTAAVALAYRKGPATPEPALTMLAEASDHRAAMPADVPGWDRALRGFVAKAIGRIGW